MALNPFLVNSEFGLKVINVATSTTTSTGEYSSETVTKTRFVEVQKKISVYKSGNNQQYTRFIFDLNKCARDIYLYIQCNIGENQDTITLEQETVSKIIGISKNTFYSGIESLRDHSVITPEQRSKYWINPFVLFRGDRIAYYREQCPDCITVVAEVKNETVK